MSRLRHHLPDLADTILAAIEHEPALKEALLDFRRACAHSSDEEASPEVREMWLQIRDELVLELRRLALRLAPIEGRTIR